MVVLSINKAIKGFQVESSKRDIQDIFSNISNSYDILNHLLSLGMDRFWRKMAVDRMPDNGPYLDVCAGTLELSLRLMKAKNTDIWITAVDFCHSMLLLGKRKLAERALDMPGAGRIKILAGDGEHLPLKEGIYQGVMIGFGLRNMKDRMSGLKEALRVLKPGGRIVVLEFSRPVNPIFRRLYDLYFSYILPPVGNLLSRGGNAYNHLRDSVYEFPDNERLALMMKEAGFVKVGYQELTLGIVFVHWASKPLLINPEAHEGKEKIIRQSR